MTISYSLVCVYNSQEQINELNNQLNSQSIQGGQRIFIDNTRNQYSSIRKAFNSVIPAITGEYVIFLHQDIRFLNNQVLENILLQANEIDHFGVIGVAGCSNTPKWEILSNIVHGDNQVHAGKNIQKPELVQTVDECFFIMKKDLLTFLEFSELEGWHMYAVEQCLRASDFGYNNYVIPTYGFWHLSDGKSLGPAYMISLKEMIKKYGYEYKFFNTTVKLWYTRGIGAYLYRQYYYFKQLIKGVILRNK